MTFSAEQKRKAAEREVAMRKRVYPRWVADKRMSEHSANEGIAIMEAIAADYAEKEKGERLL